MAMWTSGAYGLVYTVNTTNDVIVTGACANGTAGCSLRGAITEAEANPGEDQIVLAIPSSDPGCVDGVCTINLTAQLPDISRDLSISGPGPEQMIVRRATGGDYRIFRSSAIGPVSFTGFTISQGSVADTLGGGILNASIGTMTIDNCIISNNRAYRTVETSSPRGGGIANAGGGRVDITNSTITGNEANGTGGGIFNDALSVVTVRNSTLSGNGTSSSAGFVFLGGAIMNASGTVNLTNSTITGNNASGPGGAIHNVDTMTITNCTISGNSATNSIPGGNQAGGIYNLFGTTINMKGNIVALNIASDAAPDVEGNFSSSGFNLIGKNDDSSGFNTPTDRTGTIAAPLDPKLDPNGLQDNGGPTKTILLLEGSPAIDQGTSATLTEDQRGTGFPRTFDDLTVPNPVGGDGTDIGAFEVQASTPTSTTLGNISTRLRVETGDNVLIGGFIVTGTKPKKIMVRAIGPSLVLAGKLADPTLELFGPSGLISSNDNWTDSPNKQEIIDSTIPPANGLEAAIVETLNPGAYTAVVRGSNNTTGIGLVEAFDLDRTIDSELANISTRGLVETGDDVMIGGFILLGTDAQRVLVRAIGPSLPVAGKLADPTLELHDKDGVTITSNDDWRSDQEAEIIATTLPPTNDAESAVVATLGPDAYTVIVRGKNNTIGVALVEVYRLEN